MSTAAINNSEILKPFLKYLRKFSAVSEAEFQRISKYIHVRVYKIEEVVTEIGRVENYFHFILKGLVRKYYKKGKNEFNVQISHEGHIIHAQESFHSRTPSTFCVKTIEPTVLASIHFNDLETIYSQSPKMEHIGRLILTYTMILKDKWKGELIELSQKERFLKFVERHPELLRRVQQKHLASYLNIKPETFSRYKHLLQTRKQKSN